MQLAIWIITLLVVGLWTLLAWGLSGLLSLNGAWVANIDPWLAQLPFGGWLEGWFPDWLQVARHLLEGLQALLTWLGGAAPVLVWALWAVVALVLLLLAAGLSLLVGLIRRSTAAPPAAPPVAPA